MAAFLFGIVAVVLPQESLSEEVDFYSGRSPSLNSEQIAAGWLSIFDGETLYGWRREKAGAWSYEDNDWKLLDNTIAVSKGAPGLLRTGVQFDDFELRLEFKCPNDTDSGVYIRSSPRPRSTVQDCIQINIAPESAHPFPTGSIVGFDKSQGVELNSGFNSMEIRAIGNKVSVDINGKRVSESVSNEFPKKGYIGLQHNYGKIQFRNIAVRPLNLKSVFNGKDLAEWSTRKRLASQFSVENGVLNMKSGKGQLESNAQFADFIFSTHIKTNSSGLNSGVFFRCIPGDLMNGYESQIQNEYQDNDRQKPKDHGTGGIFRRMPARVVNATDEKWLAKTIIADGGTICVWVNGLLVADWTDKRPPHDNPRKGRRLKKGTIILQGHDPTTDLSFKEIRARELRSRR